MPNLSTLLLLWFALISALSAAVTILDKRAARRSQRRTSEAALFTLAALGGALSMYLTMKRIRHKTLHRRFMWGLPALTSLHLALLLLARHLGLY